MAEALRRFRALLDTRARREFYGLCALAVAAGFLESVAVASIMPFLAALFSPDISGSEPRLARLADLIGVDSQAQLLAYLGGFVLVVLVLANALSGATTWLMLRFANRKGYALSMRLLSSYLTKPYVFYLDRHTAELQKNVFGEVQRVTGGVLVPVVQIVARASVVLFISGLLVLANPLMALVVAGTLGMAYFVLYRFARATLHSVGRESVEAGGQRAKHGIEALMGFKEIKLLGRERHFLARFEKPSLRWADTQTKSQALALLPRYAVETVAFSLILVLAIYLLASGRGSGELLPLLGLYAFAGYRLMPALQLIFAGFAAIRNATPALELVLRDLQPDVASTPHGFELPLSLNKQVSLVNVRFRYPGAAGWMLESVNLSIAKNTSVALVGSTGCGKTTVVDLLMGLLEPLEGRLEVDGAKVDQRNLRQWQRNIGHVPQQIFLCDDTIARNIALGLPDEEIDWEQLERASRLARLHDFVAKLPGGYRTVVGDRGIRLSGGQRQRIGIARALYGDPELLVLDEATSALDNVTENAVFEALQALSGRKTIVMVAHRLSTVRGCDLICLMDGGRIVERGRYEDLMLSSERFRALATMAAA
jgi:ABC-type bacteriocin/lantibiotic exporter with double-glycine peptidase domain